MTVHIDYPGWLTAAKVSVLTFFANFKVLWKIWNLRSFILVSLLFQIVLILLAPFRKRTGNVWIISAIWLSYLLADYVATQAIGLVPNYNKGANSTVAGIPHADLLAFWSPFLLVHLGGPDTITALALEDNELWLRTALHLGTQVSATGRVFFQSLPSSLLWLPTVLMLIAGFLKYIERVSSLFSASVTQFKSSLLGSPDPGPNYSKLMESYDSYLHSHLQAKFETNPEPDQYNFAIDYEIADLVKKEEEEEDKQTNDNEKKPKWLPSWINDLRSKNLDRKEFKNVGAVREAFEFFNKYKGLYVDMIFTFHDRNESRADFLRRKAEQAFTLIETELNFTYEVFYTKMVVIHKSVGISGRVVAFFLEVVTLLVWGLFIDKHEFRGVDIWITYILVVGAIVLDLVSFLRVLFSDWKVANLGKESRKRAYFYDRLLELRTRPWGKYYESKDCPIGPSIRRIFFRRWSETISQFNLINYCADEWGFVASLFMKIGFLRHMCDGLRYVTRKWFDDDLRNFIFEELHYKSEIANDAKDAEEICDSKGDWVLRSLIEEGFDTFTFFQWTADVEYDEALLLWHIATELLYEAEFLDVVTNTDGGITKTVEATDRGQMKVEETNRPKEEVVTNIDGGITEIVEAVDEGQIKVEEANRPKEEANRPKEGGKFRRFCKTISDYMIYLMNRLPVMMFAVSGMKKENLVEAANRPKEEANRPEEEEKFRRFCKTISDYMIYLMNRQPVMMFAVSGIGDVRFRDTCAETTKFFHRVLPKPKPEETREDQHKKACERIMKVRTDMSPKDIKGDRSKSVLFDACRLAKELRNVKGKMRVGMWELMAKVWVELMCYSASHCRANAHAAQLKQGGELLTLVWLLMVHLGLGRQFRVTQGNARSKLIIAK